MVAIDKYDVKWKHLLNGIGVCSSPPPTPNQVFEKQLVASNVLCGTWNAITPKKSNSKALHGWWKYWRQQGKHFLQGEPSKIKDHDLQKIFDLYSAGISSGISSEMQNGLPSRMHQLSIAQWLSNIHPFLTYHGVPDSFQLSTAKDPKHYGLPEDGLPDSYSLVSGMNQPNDDTEKSDNSDRFNCDIMPSSSEEDQSASIKHLKRHPDPSLRSWDGTSFYNTERTLNNACIRADNFYRGNKKMHIHKQRSKLYKLGLFKQHNLAHLKYIQSKKNPMFDYSTDEESRDFWKEFSFSDDDEDMLMVKSLDFKLRARKWAILELPDADDEPGSGNDIVGTDSSQ
jgi:hypothetical protein